MAYKTTVGSCSLEVITRLLALLNDAVGIACAPYVAEWTAPSQWAELSADAVLGLKFAASAANLLTATVNAIEKGASFSQQLKNLAGSLLSTIAGFAKLAQLQQALANAGSSNPLLRGFSYVGAAADFLGLISSLLEQYKQYNNVSNIVIDARLNYLAAGAAYYTALQKLAIANAHCPPGTLVPAPSPPLPVPTQTVTFAPPPGAPGDNVYAYLVAGPGYQYPSGLPVGMVPPPAGYVGWWNTYSTGTTTYASTPYYVGYYSWQVLNPSVGPRILNPGSLLTVSCDFEPNWNQGWYDYNENAGTVAICGVPGITLVSGNTISNPGLDSWYYNDAITGNIPSGNLHVDLPLGPSTLVFQIPANAQSGLADVEIIGPYPGGQWSFVEGVYYFQIIAPNATTTALGASPASPVYGQPVTLAAQVSTANPYGLMQGTVDFFDQTTNQDLGRVAINSAGIAQLTVSNFNAGTQVITATYSGDSVVDYLPSTATCTFSVGQAQTNMTLTQVFSPTTYGEYALFTATVTVVPPGVGTLAGSVTFLDVTTGVNLGTVPIDSAGQAFLATNALAAGQQTIQATYTGNGNFAQSQGQCTQQVNQAQTWTTSSFSPSLPVFGSQVTLTATVASANSNLAPPTGSVDFFDESTDADLGTVNLSNGIATIQTTALAGGDNDIKMDYSGDNNYLSSYVELVVSLLPAEITTQTTVAPSPTVFGQTVNLTTAVVPVNSAIGVVPTGTVIYDDDTTDTSLGEACAGQYGDRPPLGPESRRRPTPHHHHIPGRRQLRGQRHLHHLERGPGRYDHAGDMHAQSGGLRAAAEREHCRSPCQFLGASHPHRLDYGCRSNDGRQSRQRSIGCLGKGESAPE